jgi:hypothetical protein
MHIAPLLDLIVLLDLDLQQLRCRLTRCADA